MANCPPRTYSFLDDVTTVFDLHGEHHLVSFLFDQCYSCHLGAGVDRHSERFWFSCDFLLKDDREREHPQDGGLASTHQHPSHRWMGGCQWLAVFVQNKHFLQLLSPGLEKFLPSGLLRWGCWTTQGVVSVCLDDRSE